MLKIKIITIFASLIAPNFYNESLLADVRSRSFEDRGVLLALR